MDGWVSDDECVDTYVRWNIMQCKGLNPNFLHLVGHHCSRLPAPLFFHFSQERKCAFCSFFGIENVIEERNGLLPFVQAQESRRWRIWGKKSKNILIRYGSQNVNMALKLIIPNDSCAIKMNSVLKKYFVSTFILLHYIFWCSCGFYKVKQKLVNRF